VLELGQALLDRAAPRRPENVSDEQDPQSGFLARERRGGTHVDVDVVALVLRVARERSPFDS
jgi:hypothetical protein